jgi:hypothetical protein
MSRPLKHGTSVNIHCKKYKVKHIRIKAGCQRDRYVHDIVFEAKILGRREAWELIHPDQPIPDLEFFRYLDTTWETIDHSNNDSLDNAGSNLVRMSRPDHAAKTNKAAREKREQKRKAKAKAEQASDTSVPF